MITHVVRYRDRDEDRDRWGVVDGGEVVPIPGAFSSTGDFIEGVSASALAELSKQTDERLVLEELELLSPVTRNQKFVCQGANYRQHMIESGLDPDAKTYNMIFTKASSCIVPAHSDVIRPREVRFLDYEIELGLVLRRPIHGPCSVSASNLHEFVAGAVIVNDYSARDIQIPQTQFYKGKSFRSFGPVGPVLALLDAEDIGRLSSLELELRVNGALRQRDSTANLVFKPAETLTELSRVQDFAAGDLLATGTPAGCALSVPSPMVQRIAALLPERTKWKLFLDAQAKREQYLSPGDVVESRIRSRDGMVDLGVQRNRIVAGS
ncbi:fumarylacetoacetate hydrolase family protein [Pseudenhygromyxa sp. WMMC2535]|uniref:fumarylacetoacetate hydrolase family protein n=1 Tax=Pseudenhygromyxa sp. WMMC2535 TaxID=2712867 RepID=UPI001552A13F|nr:fumarylacetoacetate hydrolase family protein [Pseudenhygromyxa sp. WMMC2535]NVB41424.1 fumarylacetoacetate hydrolase family protein [Pseudenhygromyxa sp. WMMC2535]